MSYFQIWKKVMNFLKEKDVAEVGSDSISNAITWRYTNFSIEICITVFPTERKVAYGIDNNGVKHAELLSNKEDIEEFKARVNELLG